MDGNRGPERRGLDRANPARPLLRTIAGHGRMNWQKPSGYNLRARIEASIGRYKCVIGAALRSRTDETEASSLAIAAAALNRMLEFGRSTYARIA